jgi:hypothetical protein
MSGFDSYFYATENVGFAPLVADSTSYYSVYANMGYNVQSTGFEGFYSYEGDVNTLVPTPHIWYVTPTHGRSGDGITIVGHGMGAAATTYNGAVDMLFGSNTWSAQNVTGWRFVAAGTHAYDDQRLIDTTLLHITVEHVELDITIPSNAVPPGHQLRFRTDA